jgi:hypothetical protein
MRSRGRPGPTGTTAFWIDMLCVPASEGISKTLAIASMEKVYKKAIAVLALVAFREKIWRVASQKTKVLRSH